MQTNLRYLEDMCEGSPKLIKEMIGIFSNQVDEYNHDFDLLLESKDWEQLSRLAHKAKSSVAIVGMEELANKLKDLELLARKKKRTEQYQKIINEFRKDTKEAINELNDYLKGL